MAALCNGTHSMRCFSRLRGPFLSKSVERFVHLKALTNGYRCLKEDEEYPQRDGLFTRREAQFYHRILEDNPKYSKSILKPNYFSDLLATLPDMGTNLNADLSNLSRDCVLPYTATLTRRLLDESLELSSPELIQFATYIKRYVKTVPKDDIPKILSLLYLWPANNKLLDSSMNSIIFAIDSASLILVNTKTAPVQEVLLWMEPWHWLGLCTMSEFVQVATGKLFWNADKSEHIVQLLFYMGELRTLPKHYDRPSIEKIVNRYMKKFEPDEVGILAGGFYKSSTKVTNYVLYKGLVNRVVKDVGKFHEISLNAVLKLLRVNISHFKEPEDVLAIYKALTPHMSTMSELCLVQFAMLGTAMEIVDRDLMRTILSLLCKLIQNLREKDFQRVMYSGAIGMDEEDMKAFVQHTVVEINRRKLPTLHHSTVAKPTPQICKKGISFIECVLFLHIMGHRSRELLASAIEMGKALNVGPDRTLALFYLDVIANLLYPDYCGPRLDEIVAKDHHATKLKRTFPPVSRWFTYEWREATAEMQRTFYLDVCDACGGRKNVACETILPFYVQRDLVLCTDNDGHFLAIPPEFGTEAPWKAKRACNTASRAFCVIMLLRDRSGKGLPDFTLYQKFRAELLRTLGYRIALVKYKVFEEIPKADKFAHILEAIKSAS